MQEASHIKSVKKLQKNIRLVLLYPNLMYPKHFKVGPEGFKSIQRQSLIRSLFVITIALIVGLSISYYNTGHHADDIFVLSIAVPISLIAIAISLRRGLNRQKELYESYLLTIDKQIITRVQKDTPVVQINKEEIKEIIKQNNGSFTITSTATTHHISIPVQVEQYEELEALLNQIKPITQKSFITFCEQYSMLMVIIILVLMNIIFLSTNKLMVSLGGILLFSVLSWSLYECTRSRNIDRKTKRSLWWIAILLLVVVGRTIITGLT